jgi:acyl-CoA dehydrogenase
MLSSVFRLSKNLLPKISETEMIALRSGTVSVDRMIFQGKIDYSKLPDSKIKQKSLSNEQHFNLIQNVTKKIGTHPLYLGKKNSDLMKFLGDQGVFGFIIDEKYQGLKLSVEDQSRILTLYSSHNPSLGVMVMVPNSLGPGELLQHYGTEEQKNYYLPKLATGEMIPCFGLTGPHNGSDAGGLMDTGIIQRNQKGELVIKTKVNKRYITLAPIADLVGLAIKVRDPNNYLGKSGITVVLLEKNHPNLELFTWHNPNNIGFPNGTVKGELEIPLSKVIGGEKNIGNGWKMLMECLAAGRGISLPASAQGATLTCWYGISGYANLREQFKIPLMKMQGVQEKLAEITYQSWITKTSIKLTNYLLDSGEKPAVISAIMKHQITERGRKVVNHAMDIYAGSGICLGENNFIQKYYQASPVGITVEGSNTLTRSLIIFGQGLNKSHPHIANLVMSLQNNDELEFNKEFKKMLSHTLGLYVNNMTNRFSISFENNLIHQINLLTSQYANLSNLVSLMGGKLKKEQRLSGYMADYLSNLYLASSVIWYSNRHFYHNSQLTEYCLKRLINEIKEINQKIILELPIHLRLLYLPTSKNYYHHLTTEEEKNISNILWTDNRLREEIEYQISMLPVLKKIQQANLTDDLEVKRKLVDQIIQVEEYGVESQ